VTALSRWSQALRLFVKYRRATMVYPLDFLATLELARNAPPGCLVECGVWRGGMAAAMLEVCGEDRILALYDSFEGLPPPTAEDGEAAAAWAADVDGPRYFDNCRASRAELDATLARLPAGDWDIRVVEGWFNDTLTTNPPPAIGFLRLDCDWYNSVSLCLETLWPLVAPGGVVVFDDYLHWAGCRRAVDAFVAQTSPRPALRRWGLSSSIYLVKSA